MKKVRMSRKLAMKVIVFAMILSCNVGVLPNVTVFQSQTVITAQAATAGQKNALKSAKTYLKITPFSKKGLIDQLKFDGYTTKEAKYAAKNCGASWKKQAVKAAKSYLDIMSFSKKELREQLEFDGYTASEAKYGVEKAYK